MTANTTNRQLLGVVLALVAALVVLPVFVMGLGTVGGGPMMDGTWHDHMWSAGEAPGWLLVIGLGMQVLFLGALVATAYLGYRAVTEQDDSADPALEELRVAYARGDLSDEEYERRRDRLESER